MTYTVLWKSDAEDQLARLWMDAENRNAVRRAADKIDQLLGDDPLKQGESRSAGVRVMFVDPLAVFYQVQEQDRTVWVARVWSTGD